MSEGELWSVRLKDGRTIQCTLDQLDMGFESGHVDADALVLAPGTAQWVRLGELAGIDAPKPAASPTPAPVCASVPPPTPASLRPVSADLDLDLPAVAHAASSSKKWIVGGALGAIAVVGALVFVIASNGSGASSPATTAAAAAPPPPATTTTTTEAAPATPPPPATTDAPRLSDEQRKKLADLDKQNEQKAKAKAKSRAISYGGGHHSSKPIKAQGFTTGGNKYDPLNMSN